MVQPGIHTLGTPKPTYSSLINRMLYSHNINPVPALSDSSQLLRVGVGFSYADYGETVETTEDAARNVHAFITIFFETFSDFAGRPLHLSGESYAGKYLPVFASYIYDQNRAAEAAGRNPINLQSVLIGNGITDIST